LIGASAVHGGRSARRRQRAGARSIRDERRASSQGRARAAV